MGEPDGFTYDRFHYRGAPFQQSHPRWLATLGVLHGLEPARRGGSRVLELGCGFGANLLPMALDDPGSRFVGADLSEGAIAHAQGEADALGLTNIRFIHGDILDLGPSLGTFDYIIAHGVYSWVPDGVRLKIMALLRDCLAPQGIGYLSYNCLPGHRLKAVAADLMRFHTRDVADPARRLDMARAVMGFAAQSSPAHSVYGAVLRDQANRVAHLPDEVLFHDDLEPEVVAFTLTEMAQRAAEHGLAYLSDAAPSRSQLPADSPLRQILDAVPPEARLVREQYLDHFIGRAYRESLFCRAGRAPRPGFGADDIDRLSLALSVTPAGEAQSPATEDARFEVLGGGALSTNHPLTKAALARLGQAYPAALPFDDLVGRAGGDLPAPPTEEDIGRLRALLFQLFELGRLEAWLEPPALSNRPGQRPVASPLARRQARDGPLVTSLTHGVVDLGDDTMRALIQLLDGTRTAEDCLAALAGRTVRTDDREAPVALGDVRHGFDALARLALLVR